MSLKLLTTQRLFLDSSFVIRTIFSTSIITKNAIMKHLASRKAPQKVSRDLELHRMCEIGSHPQELSNLEVAVPNLSENSCGLHTAASTPVLQHFKMQLMHSFSESGMGCECMGIARHFTVRSHNDGPKLSSSMD